MLNIEAEVEAAQEFNILLFGKNTPPGDLYEAICKSFAGTGDTCGPVMAAVFYQLGLKHGAQREQEAQRQG